MVCYHQNVRLAFGPTLFTPPLGDFQYILLTYTNYTHISKICNMLERKSLDHTFDLY